MPDLVGMSLETAHGILVSQGLTLGEVKRAPSDEPSGNVLVQYPEEGMTVRDGDTVSVIVAMPAGGR
jgi:beta-lactam-binding protein with PASTA domain